MRLFLLFLFPTWVWGLEMPPALPDLQQPWPVSESFKPIERHPGVLEYVLRKGQGPLPFRGDLVSMYWVHWTGASGRWKVVESHLRPMWMVLGDPSLNPMWEEALYNTHLGGHHQLRIRGEEGEQVWEWTLVEIRQPDLELPMPFADRPAHFPKAFLKPFVDGSGQEVAHLWYEDIVQGKGPVVHEGDLVAVHYSFWQGEMKASTVVAKPSLPVLVRIGKSKNFWLNMGLEGMRQGGKRRMEIRDEEEPKIIEILLVAGPL